MNKRILTLLLILFLGTGTPGFAVTTLCPDTQASVRPQLQAAREKLRLSETTRDRVARELEDFKQSDQADPGLLKDYATYLQRVQDLVDENRRIVRKMEALCTAEASPTIASGGEKPALQPDTATPGEETVDEVTLLDRRLRDSLASFDEMLLKRINAIKAESAGKMRDLAEQAAQAAGRARQRGTGPTTSAQNRKGGQQGEETSQGPGSSRQGQRASRGEPTGRQGTASGTGKPGSSPEATARQGSGKAPAGAGSSTDTSSSAARTYSRDNDDIVARQLREAAEQEKDPELKKKLWKEYEDYKKNTRP